MLLAKDGYLIVKPHHLYVVMLLHATYALRLTRVFLQRCQFPDRAVSVAGDAEKSVSSRSVKFGCSGSISSASTGRATATGCTAPCGGDAQPDIASTPCRPSGCEPALCTRCYRPCSLST
jgi:hypothetical protein